MYLYFFREDMAILLLIEGRSAEALPLVRRCLQVSRRAGIRLDVCEVLFAAACCASWQGEQLKAARLFGAADVRIGYALADGSITWSAIEEQLRTTEQGRLRELMGEREFGEAYRQGTRRLSRAAGSGAGLAVMRWPAPHERPSARFIPFGYTLSVKRRKELRIPSLVTMFLK